MAEGSSGSNANVVPPEVGNSIYVDEYIRNCIKNEFRQYEITLHAQIDSMKLMMGNILQQQQQRFQIQQITQNDELCTPHENSLTIPNSVGPEVTIPTSPRQSGKRKTGQAMSSPSAKKNNN